MRISELLENLVEETHNGTVFNYLSLLKTIFACEDVKYVNLIGRNKNIEDIKSLSTSYYWTNTYITTVEQALIYCNAYIEICGDVNNDRKDTMATIWIGKIGYMKTKQLNEDIDADFKKDNVQIIAIDYPIDVKASLNKLILKEAEDDIN